MQGCLDTPRCVKFPPLTEWACVRVQCCPITISLLIRGDAVVLEVQEDARTRRFEFNRVWAKLVLGQRARSVRLALRSHGREVEIGRYLDGGGRCMLARELKARLQASNR